MDNQILMLFRCTERGYAESFVKSGTLRFGKPTEWIEYEKRAGQGRGDINEGIYASIPSTDIKLLKKVVELRDDVECETINGISSLRCNRILNMPTFCLYGLFQSSLDLPYKDGSGRQLIGKNVEQSYFTDFYMYNTREEINQLPLSKQPVLVLIKSPAKFLERLKSYLIEMGISNEEIIVERIRYLDMRGFICSSPYPTELFLKDIRFKGQSELRVTINTDDKTVFEKLESNNNIVDIGNLEDICEILDYYLEEMSIGFDGRSIAYSLPIPITTSLEDMTLEELQDMMYRVKYDKDLDVEGNDHENALKSIRKVLKDKYNMHHHMVTHADGTTEFI